MEGGAVVREADERLRRAVLSVAPDLEEFDHLAIVATRGGRLSSLRSLIEQLTPRGVEVLPAALVAQARRNAAARLAFLEEFGALTADQVADLARSAARNRHEMASRLKRAGQAFTVDHDGQAYYPAFQFTPAGRPRSVVAEVLAASDLEGWELALWFVTASPWLDGRRPVDVLDEEPAAVVEAVRQDRAAHVF